MTTSPEYWETNWRDLVKQKDPAMMEKLNKWATKSIKAGENFYGKDNIVSVDLHLDETTPHLHIIAVPIIEHNNKIKLAAKYLYTPEKLRDWQSAYAADMSEFKLERGIEGSKAKHVHFTEHKKEMELRATVEAELKSKDQDQVQRAYAAGLKLNREAAEQWKAVAEQERLIGQGLSKKIERYQTAILDYEQTVETLESKLAVVENKTLDFVQQLQTMKINLIQSVTTLLRMLENWVEQLLKPTSVKRLTPAQTVSVSKAEGPPATAIPLASLSGFRKKATHQKLTIQQ